MVRIAAHGQSEPKLTGEKFPLVYLPTPEDCGVVSEQDRILSFRFGNHPTPLWVIDRRTGNGKLDDKSAIAKEGLREVGCSRTPCPSINCARSAKSGQQTINLARIQPATRFSSLNLSKLQMAGGDRASSELLYAKLFLSQRDCGCLDG